MNFDEKLDELEQEEQELSKNGEQQTDLDNLDPTQVESLLAETNKANEYINPSAPQEDKSGGEIDKTQQPETAAAKEDEKIVEDDKQPEAEISNQPSNATDIITIDDEYLAKADEKDRNILAALKGEKLSPKVLQNYVNAQRHIGKLGQQLGQVKEQKTEIETEIAKKAIPDNIPQQQFTQEVEQWKEAETINRLRKQGFPDIPDDPDELNEYLASLQVTRPRDFYRYMESEKKVSQEVAEDINRTLYIQNHQNEINQNILQAEISKIESELKEWGIDDLKGIGIDFTINKTNDGKSDNALLRELITTNGKDLDPNLVTYYGNIPVFNENALFNKFFVAKGKIIRDVMKQKVSLGAKQEAFNELSKVQDQANNSATKPKGNGTFSTTVKKNYDDMNPNEIEEALKRF